MTKYKSLSTGQMHEMEGAPSALPYVSWKPSNDRRTSSGRTSVTSASTNFETAESFWQRLRSPIEQTEPTSKKAKRKAKFTGPYIAVSPYAGGSCHEAIERAGGRAITIRSSTLLTEVDKCQGLLIPGGRDVAPSLYGQEQERWTQTPDLDRDNFEIALIKYALRHKMAILGICRGHQLLNVAMGGTLIQDLAKHHSYTHPVNIDPESRTFGHLEGHKITVNSLHHQAVDRVARNMKPVAWHPDGTVEAIEHVSRSFVVGVQWHPEMDGVTPRFGREMRALWKAFVNAGRDPNKKEEKVS